MVRSGRAKRKQNERRRLKDAAAGGGKRHGSTAGGAGIAPRTPRSRLADKRPILRFVLTFGLLVGGFNVWFHLWFSKGSLFESYLRLNAQASAAVLRFFGDDASASGTMLIASRYSVNLKRGCDAIQASAFFVLGVLSLPAPVSLLSRLPALVIGTVLLLIVNLVRIVSLYYTGVCFPKAFEVMHVDVWQPLFIFLPLFFWIVWAWRAGRRKTVSADVTA